MLFCAQDACLDFRLAQRLSSVKLRYHKFQKWFALAVRVITFRKISIFYQTSATNNWATKSLRLRHTVRLSGR